DEFVEVYNKLDRLDPEARDAWTARATREANAACLSAITGEGTDRLLTLIDKRLAALRQTVEYDLPFADGAALAWLHEHGQVLDSRAEDGHLHVTVALDPADRQRFEHRLRTAS
ncbi:MAG: GTPase HflX, partial [Tagaea sp.]